MASLTGTKVSDTYQQLLKLTSQGVGADASAKYIEDGLGTDTALSLSTTRVGIGTASPGSLFEVKGTGETQIYINSASGNNSGVRFLENDANKWTIGHDQSDDSLFFYDFGASAKRLYIESDGTVVMAGALQPAGNITQSANTNLRHTITAGGSGEASLVLTANNSTGDSFVRWETNANTFCMGLDNSDSNKFILSAGSDPHSNSVINIQPDGSSIAVDKPISFGGVVQLLDVAQSIDFIQSGAINFDSNGDQTGRVLTIGSNRTGDSGGTTNVTFEESGNTIFSGDAKVGFGAGTPGAQVEIRDDDTSAAANSYHEILRINNQTGNASDRTAMIGFSTYTTGGNTMYCGARTEGTGAQTAFEIGVHSGATLEERFRIASDSHTTVNITSTPTGANQPSQKIQFRGYHANTGDGKRTFAKIQGQKHNNTGGAVGGDLLFFTNDDSNNLTQRLAIDEDGVLIASGTTSSTSKINNTHTFYANHADTAFAIDNQSSGNAFGLQVRYSATGHGTGGYFISCYANPSGSLQARFIVAEDGDVTNANNSYSSISDQRVKKDITDANSQWDDIKALKIRNYKKDEPGDDKVHIGVVAQELEEAGMNGLVKEMEATDIDVENFPNINEGDKIKSVKYSVLYMKAIKALQEAMAKIETLEARLNDLEPEEPEQEQSPTVKERVNSLEARVNDLENG
tara:strand:+ start:1972 stop:4035 length:2064 start_codon:yes stop_codon:yes gene_type:complete